MGLAALTAMVTGSSQGKPTDFDDISRFGKRVRSRFRASKMLRTDIEAWPT